MFSFKVFQETIENMKNILRTSTMHTRLQFYHGEDCFSYLGFQQNFVFKITEKLFSQKLH